MILDIGSSCYPNPKADILLDIHSVYTREVGNHKDLQEIVKDRPFINADAQYLPFRDNIFSLVFSSHTIEHVNSPLLMIKEMIRISNKRVEIICPHVNALYAKMPYHLWTLNEKWFLNNGFSVIILKYWFPIEIFLAKVLYNLKISKTWTIYPIYLLFKKLKLTKFYNPILKLKCDILAIYEL